MRKYNDPVAVQRGWVTHSATEGPAQFTWHGRVWQVRQVLTSWVETGHWWHGLASPDQDLLAERELWRVEAGASSTEATGVFDLSFSWEEGSWRLVGCLD